MQAWVKEWIGDEEAARLAAEGRTRDRYNIAPSETLLAATLEQGVRRLVPMRWGFPIDGKEVCNTRIEEAWERPMWQRMMGSRHAVVPVTGFYEWLPGRRPVPFWFHPSAEGPLLLAGVWEHRHGEDGTGAMPSLSIVTTAAADPVRDVHDRMPLALAPDQVMAWLTAKNPDDVRAMGATPRLEGHQVGPEVNQSTAEGPDLIRPAQTWF